MMEFIANINVEQMIKALNETLYMSFVSLLFAVLFGLIVGIFLYCTQTGGLYQNKFLNKVIDWVVNILRAIPFIILLILLIPFAIFATGKMLGATAALPSLIVAATPFYARLCVIALTEVDKGTVEASKAMGASKIEIITKVLLPEALPALVSGICVTGVSLISYTAMAGTIGSGGLGNLAYQYGFMRRNDAMLFTATLLLIIIVFLVQGIGDYFGRKIDKR